MSLAITSPLLTKSPEVQASLSGLPADAQAVLVEALLADTCPPDCIHAWAEESTGAVLVELCVPYPTLVPVVERLGSLFDCARLPDGDRWRVQIPSGLYATAADRTCDTCGAAALTRDEDGGAYCADCGAD